MTRFRFLHRNVFSLLIAGSLFSGVVQAQDSQVLSTRLPAEGLAILDCAPPDPAPENSCLVRVPSGLERGDMRSKALGQGDADFQFVRAAEELPDGLTLSATVVLIDLSIGNRSARLKTWKHERDLILELIRGLPAGERIAVYGFGNDFSIISEFSSNRLTAIDAVQNLKISEKNTRMLANVERAIELLQEEDKTLFKNLVLVTDGDEEGLETVDQITQSAARAGVTVSAFGTFWRGEGDARTTRGIDVLKRLTASQSGLMEEAFLKDKGGSKAAVGRFVQQYATSVGGSGLILPDDTPSEARITVDMKEPVLGQPGRTQLRSYTVRFVPAMAEVPPETEPAPVTDPETPHVNEEVLIFGFPALYVYLAGGLAAILLLLLLFLLLRHRPNTEDEQLEIDASNADLPELDGSKQQQASDLAAAEKAAQPQSPPPIAYLVRTDNGARFAVPQGRSTVGRSSSNAVTVSDGGVSRVHAELNGTRQGGFVLTDLDSLNGSFVNNKKFKGTQNVSIGDTLGFGAVRMKLVLA